MKLASSIAKSVLYTLLFVACQVAASVGVGVFLGLAALFVPDLDPTMVVAFNYEIMLLSALLFFGIVTLIHLKDPAMAFGMKKTSPTAVLAGAFGGFGCFLCALALVTFASLFPAYAASQESYAQQMESTLSGSLFMEMAYVCLVGPLLEEVLFRGLCLGTLKKATSPFWAVFLSALLFGLVHGNLYQLVFTLPLGVLLGVLALRFDSLWPSVALHVTFNFANYPIRIAEKVGYAPESKVVMFLEIALLLFCVFAIPLSLLCYKSAPKKNILFKKEKNMAAPEYLIVGLGNPGDKYAATRHNAGFTALEYIAAKENGKVQTLKFKALTASVTMGGKSVLLMKPQTFMNLSGEAVREAAAFYKIPPEKILVLFDDINFAPGVFRIRPSGSAGGHNGIKSIISCLGSQDFPRVKIGVGNPPEGWELMNWVLGKPAPQDQKRILAAMGDVYETALLFLQGDLDRAGALYNGKMHE